jgi:hypothetical protein
MEFAVEIILQLSSQINNTYWVQIALKCLQYQKLKYIASLNNILQQKDVDEK